MSIARLLTLDSVLESWVIVLLNDMYLKSLTHAQNTQMAILLLFDFDLFASVCTLLTLSILYSIRLDSNGVRNKL